MEEWLVDKLRKISNSTNDEFLIKELNLLFQNYASDLEYTIPNNVQTLLEGTARKKQHNLLFYTGDSYPNANPMSVRNSKVLTFNETNQTKDILNSIISNVGTDSSIDIDSYNNGYQLFYKYNGNLYEICVNSNTKTIIFAERLGTATLAKVLKDNGFKVEIIDTDTLEINW